MIKYAAFLLFAINVLVSSAEARLKLKKYVWLEELQTCATEHNYSRINGSFHYSGHGLFFLNIDITTKVQFDHLYSFVDLKRCPTKLATDDCELMMTFPMGDQCNFDNSYFQYIFNQFDPPVSCPLPAGYYRARDILLNPEMYNTFFRGFGEEDWLHVKIDGYLDENRLTKKENCLVIIATIKNARVEEKANRNKKQRRKED
ncbi:uncharacterized protein [Halyomorpha halys]|uniref:uncharacterized protein n=1 Tax=Halyomorpha halys TaxID=286706 RepID=UPI0006D4E72E|nr:uncharacterized protein LOC106690367 [Halyomorpha halys]